MKFEPIILLAALSVLSLPLAAQPAQAAGADRGEGASLGVMARRLSFETLASLGLEYGVGVAEVVPGSPAERAGLERGDMILALGGKPVYAPERLRWLVSQAPAGEDLSLTYYRGGQTETVKIRLQSREPPAGRALAWSVWPRRTSSYLGVQLQPMTDELRELFKAPEGTGLLVVRVHGDSPAQRAGLVVGDVIVRMGRKTIRSIADVYRVLDFFDPGDAIDIEIIRDKESRMVTIGLVAPPDRQVSPPGYGWWSTPHQTPLPLPHPRYWRKHLEEFLDELDKRFQEIPEPYFRQRPGYL